MTSDNRRRTIDSYEQIAREYAEDTATSADGSGFAGEGLRRLVEAMPAGGTVLEVGSGAGWDADYLESLGARVRRTDVTQAFIDFQAERGKHVDRLDLATDGLGGPYDAVMAMAVLQHLDRELLPDLFRKFAAALMPRGLFLTAIPLGSGEHWEVGESGNQYFTVLWTETDFTEHLEDAGFGIEWRFSNDDSDKARWLVLLSRKAS